MLKFFVYFIGMFSYCMFLYDGQYLKAVSPSVDDKRLLLRQRIIILLIKKHGQTCFLSVITSLFND